MRSYINSVSVGSALIWLCLISIAVFINLVPGLYLYDLFLVGYCLVLGARGQLHISAVKNKYLTMLIVFVFFPLLISILLNVISDGGFNQELSFFYYAWNLSIFVLYFISLECLKKDVWKTNVNLVLLLVSVPVIISEIMFFVPSAAAYLKAIYRIDQVGVYGRYGGLYGTGLAGFAMHSFTVVFYSLFLFQIKLIRFAPMFLFSLIGLLGMILSGIRTGMIVLLALFLLLYFFRGFKLLGVKSVASIVVASLLLIFSLKLHNENLYNYVVERYSLERLLLDTSLSAEGARRGNVHNLKVVLNKNLNHLNENPFLILIGDSGLKHDIPYLDVVFKHGLIFVLITSMFILFFLAKRKFLYRAGFSELLLFCLLFASIIFSFKANSIFHNIFMFTSIYMVIYLRKALVNDTKMACN